MNTEPGDLRPPAAATAPTHCPAPTALRDRCA